MALGDGIRRNINSLTRDERDRFRAALLALLGRRAAGARAEHPPLGLGAWFEQDERYEATHLHYGAEFLPWHREQCARFECMLRQIDPQLSLHYWDWNDDPHALFDDGGDRRAGGGTDMPFSASDDDIVRAGTFAAMRALLERKRADAHVAYAAATRSRAHMSFRDPFVFPLHSNVDRLFAMWQAAEPWRLDPAQVYGEESTLLAGVFVEPWTPNAIERPWQASEPDAARRTYVHPTIVAPPCYDSLPTRVVVDETANPGHVIHFHDVQPGRLFARAASFRVFGCGQLTFRVCEGPSGPYSVITPAGAVKVAHAGGLYQEARIWFGFQGHAPGAAPAGRVVIRCDELDRTFAFTLRANTMAPHAAGPSRPRDSDRVRPPREAAQQADVTWTWSWRAAAS